MEFRSQNRDPHLTCVNLERPPIAMRHLKICLPLQVDLPFEILWICHGGIGMQKDQCTVRKTYLTAFTDGSRIRDYMATCISQRSEEHRVGTECVRTCGFR